MTNKGTDITNFYSLLPKDKQKPPAGFKNHLIECNSRLLFIGQSGSGKTNTLLNYIERSSGEYQWDDYGEYQCDDYDEHQSDDYYEFKCDDCYECQCDDSYKNQYDDF